NELHALVKCPWAAAIWEKAGLEDVVECLVFLNFTDWFLWVLQSKNREQVELIAVILWNIWFDRNCVRLGGDPKYPATVVAGAQSILEAFQSAKEKLRTAGTIGQQRTQSQQRAQAKWELPPVGWLKVNTDAAIFGDLGCGLGVVISDYEGSARRVACSQVRHSWSVEITEAKAIVLGLQVANQCHERNIIVECDNSLIIKKLKENKVDGSYLGVILREVKHLSSLFHSVVFSHVFREANEAAHTMAHLTPVNYSVRIWAGSVPNVVEDVIASDFCIAYNNNT
ncbi:hypothetical protein SOVF_206000, partial [Spinacia oleracea]